MTTKQIELRTETKRKAIVLNRIAQPYERAGMAAVVVIGCLGVSAAIALGFVLAGVL